jgi:3-hydroxybutyryl-CoA dehydrogenase
MTATQDGKAAAADDAPAAVIQQPADGTIVVIGGGTMGAGIAQSLLSAQYQVHLIESDEVLASRAYDRVRLGLRRPQKSHRDSDAMAEQGLRALTIGVEYDAGVGVDVVIEAVPEVVDIKHAVLQRAS